MICPNCGKEIEENARFCSNCGAPAPPAEPTKGELPFAAQARSEPQAPIEPLSTLPAEHVPKKTDKRKAVKIISIVAGVCILAGLLIAFLDSDTFYVYFKAARKAFDSQSAMETYLSGEWKLQDSSGKEYYVFTNKGLYCYNDRKFKESKFWEQADLRDKTIEDFINFPGTVRLYKIRYDYRHGLIKNADDNSIIFIVLQSGDLEDSVYRYEKITEDASFPSERFRNMWDDICLYSEDLKHETTREVLRAATCKEEGVEQITCNHCHRSWTEPISKEHNYDENWNCITCGEKAPFDVEWKEKCYAPEDLIIGCAQQLIESILKNPSSVIYNDAKVYAYDHYGRVIVYVDFSSENSFGGYVRDKWYVLFHEVTKSGEFNYNGSMWHCDANDYSLSAMKSMNFWDVKKPDA